MSYNFGAPPRAHVWHQGRKVTSFAGGGYSRRYGRYRWQDPQRLQQEHKERQLRWWRAHPVPTVSDRSSYSSTVRIAEAWFRLLDAHGKPHGRRYTRVGPSDSDMFMVVDQHGNETWLDGAARVRIVTQQPEDLSSQASRIITRMHRQLAKESQ